MFPQAKIKLLIDISKNCFKLLSRNNLNENEKSQLEDLLVFSNNMLLNSNAIEETSNLETIFEILMIQCDGLIRRALSLDKEKKEFLDKIMEYGLAVCQKAFNASAKSNQSWMSHNAIAQFWKLFCELYYKFPSELWNEPIAKMYDDIMAENAAKDTIKSIVTIMYVNTQLDAQHLIISKNPTSNSKNSNAANNFHLKNAEEALKNLAVLKDENLAIMILSIPCWIRMHHLKSQSNTVIPPLDFEDSMLKLISNFEIQQKDVVFKTTAHLSEYLETSLSQIKGLSCVPTNFQIRLFLKVAKIASDLAQIDISLGIYSKVFDQLDNLEFHFEKERLDTNNEANQWIAIARLDTLNRVSTDFISADNLYQGFFLQYIVETYRKQCIKGLVNTSILQGTLRCIWNYSINVMNDKFGDQIVEQITKFLARTVKSFLSDSFHFKKHLLESLEPLESQIILDLIKICVEYYVNTGNQKLAIEILDSTSSLASPMELLYIKSNILQKISKRKLLDYRSCLVFSRALKNRAEKAAVLQQGLALIKDLPMSIQEKQEFFIEVISIEFFESALLSDLMMEQPVLESNAYYLIACLIYEIKKTERMER